MLQPSHGNALESWSLNLEPDSTDYHEGPDALQKGQLHFAWADLPGEAQQISEQKEHSPLSREMKEKGWECCAH